MQAHEYAAWYWHVAARTLVGLLTGTLGAPADRLTERSLGKRILCFTSVGTVSGLAGKPWGRGGSQAGRHLTQAQLQSMPA